MQKFLAVYKYKDKKRAGDGVYTGACGFSACYAKVPAKAYDACTSHCGEKGEIVAIWLCKWQEHDAEPYLWYGDLTVAGSDTVAKSLVHSARIKNPQAVTKPQVDRDKRGRFKALIERQTALIVASRKSKAKAFNPGYTVAKAMPRPEQLNEEEST